MKKAKIISSLLICLILFLWLSSSAQQGEGLFKKNCAACHTIGGGKLVGPDLMGISQERDSKWLFDFIKSSRSMISSGDARSVEIAKAYNNMLMPDYPGPDTEIDVIIGYIDSKSNGGEASSSDKKPRAQTSVFVGDVDTGRMLFEGYMNFKNKGASCIACHHVNFQGSTQGGLLAKDLTTSFTTSGGEAGLKAIIANPPFPSMREAYQNYPISPQEIAHLSAYLKASSETKTELGPILIPDTIIIALFLAAFLFFIIGVSYSKRKKESVNKDIIKRQSRFK